MTQLVYTEEELWRSHDYARPHVVAGQRLHGGFDAQGRYVPPRIRVRGPAIEAWITALRQRGGDLLAADASLLEGVRYPTEAQQKLLIQEGLGQTFWNTLTITGLIEARGRVLADLTFPDLQDVLEEDVSRMAVGHLNKGLLHIHGIDEGGEPGKGIGGHDVMWFAVRDLAFGETRWPVPAVPERIGRPDSLGGEFAEIDNRYEQVISFLLNLLLIEFRAEIGFRFSQQLLRDPELFVERRAQAEEAAEIIGRIRADEEIHVRSLRLYLGELRSLTFKTRDGGRKPGHEIIDPFWQRVAHWATVEQPKLQAEQQRAVLTERIRAHPEGARIQARFDALEHA
ncbi:MAG: hypothetical protein JSU66_01375 [Deltaproteobacteria bacterium]|nr:MAG: hypothetical protein JSU66_01375 [Deltaproteobacteria bacterium]